MRRHARARAWTDPLTGLANRRASRRALDRTRPGDAVALVELDRPPGVVEASDDGGGDRLLCAFASLLDAELGPDDHAGRRGGDQLLVVLAATAPPEALAVVERLSTSWARTRPEPVTFSAGVACVDAPGAGVEAVEAADRALARAKAGGRGHTRVATAEDHP
jgi:diguanylate cyclase (GGDEF)-like protein